MSYDHKIENIENNILTVAVQGSDNGYVLWQKNILKVEEDSEVYFEYNDQINGGYNNIKECTVTNDGIHIVLHTNQLFHFYFPKGFNKHTVLKASLKKIYSDNEKVLEFIL